MTITVRQLTPFFQQRWGEMIGFRPKVAAYLHPPTTRWPDEARLLVLQAKGRFQQNEHEILFELEEDAVAFKLILT